MSNQKLDKFAKTNPLYYYFTFLSIIGYFLYSAITHGMPWYKLFFLIAIGLLIWSLVEYLMHRFVFHWQSSQRLIQIIHYLLHGIHHTYPRDVRASITPLVISIPLSIMFYFIFNLVFGDAGSVIFAGFVLGYVLYTVIHDATHHFPMNYPLLREIKKNHMYHHYFENEGNFGVSTPIWDYIFKTYQENHAYNRD